ncbi:MAG UNVERIFIED_CONTAM: hypothetical protein LVR29_30015 [Microcystis novacekii LVE1205-3]
MALATGISLTRYAIWQGRNHPDQAIAEIWVYLGILEATGHWRLCCQYYSSDGILL